MVISLHNSIDHPEMEKKEKNFEDGVRLPMCQEIIITLMLVTRIMLVIIIIN